MGILDGKTVIVTGGSRRLGAAIAKRLAKDGARVALNHRTGNDDAAQVVADIEDAGGEAWATHADVTASDQITTLFAQVADRFGAPDIVVANAGMELIDTPITEIDDEGHDRITIVKVYGMFYTLREAARRVAEDGRIVLIGSTTTFVPNAGFIVYAGSKAGGASMSRRWRRRWVRGA